MVYWDKLWSHMSRTLSIIIRPNWLDIKFDSMNDMITHKETEHKVLSYKGDGCRANELALVRGCACWAHKSLTVFIDDNCALA